MKILLKEHSIMCKIFMLYNINKLYNMVNILFITYYGIRDQLKFVSDSLIKLNNCMYNFSLMEIENDNIRNKGKEYMPYDLLIESININQIDVVLWWYIGTPYKKMEYVIQKTGNIKHIMYNWDDPNGWEDRELDKKAKLFDCVFTCCKESIDRYIKYGTKNCFYLIPGYDPNTNFIISNIDDIDDKYDCDISIVCTTLYENNLYDMRQYINRKELIDNLYQNREKFKFHIYGPKFLMDLYPECYKPYDITNNKFEVPYMELNKIFNGSKLNICTHTHCQYDGYLNERVGLILGSGGLLYVDKVKGIENIYKDGKDCVYIDKDRYIKQICDILENYDDYYEIKTNGHEKSKLYNWDCWAECIQNEYLIKMDTIEPQFIKNVEIKDEDEIKDETEDETKKETENIKQDKQQNKTVKYQINDNSKITINIILDTTKNMKKDVEINITI
jgi:hypothetical protein